MDIFGTAYFKSPYWAIWLVPPNHEGSYVTFLILTNLQLWKITGIFWTILPLQSSSVQNIVNTYIRPDRSTWITYLISVTRLIFLLTEEILPVFSTCPETKGFPNLVVVCKECFRMSPIPATCCYREERLEVVTVVPCKSTLLISTRSSSTVGVSTVFCTQLAVPIKLWMNLPSKCWVMPSIW